MRLVKSICFALCIICLLSGCNRYRDPSAVTADTSSTVNDIFKEYSFSSVPSESESVPASVDETIAPSAPSVFVPSENLGSVSIGLATEYALDDHGPYLVYKGGEMELSIDLAATESLGINGVGILLFVDGRPQPYQTVDGPQYAYMHVVYPSIRGKITVDVRFIPVTGKKGDDLEVYAVPILDPYRTLTDNRQGPSHTFGVPAAGFRLKYEQTPPEEDFPKKQQRLLDTSVSFVDATYNEIGHWTDDELLEKNEAHLYVGATDDSGKNIVYGMSTNNNVSARFELLGSPYVHYGVVFFVENEPVFPENGEPFFIDVRTGQKTIIEATLSMKEFDGESPVYAVLVPRNYRSSEVLTTCFLHCSGTLFLTAWEGPQ